MNALDELRAENRREGQKQLLLRQLETRFGALPERRRVQLAKATSDDLVRWGTRILKASGLDEVFAPPRDPDAPEWSVLDQLIEDGFESAFDEGIDGMRRILRHLLTKRFGVLPDDLEAQVATDSGVGLFIWTVRCVSGRSLEQVFAPWST